MRQFLLIISIILLPIIAYSQATVGTRVTSPIVPNDSADVYGTHDEFFGVGGYRTCNDTVTRNLIKTALRKEGMEVYVKADSSFYQLRRGINNINWQKINFSEQEDTAVTRASSTIYIAMETDTRPGHPAGNDITGDGSINKPFATLKKAYSMIKPYAGNGAITTTVSLDSGDFFMSIQTFQKLNELKGNRAVTIQGTKLLYTTVKGTGGITPDASDPFKGTLKTNKLLSANELSGKFAKWTGSGAISYPIYTSTASAGDSSTTIITTGQFTSQTGLAFYYNATRIILDPATGYVFNPKAQIPFVLSDLEIFNPSTTAITNALIGYFNIMRYCTVKNMYFIFYPAYTTQLTNNFVTHGFGHYNGYLRADGNIIYSGITNIGQFTSINGYLSLGSCITTNTNSSYYFGSQTSRYHSVVEINGNLRVCSNPSSSVARVFRISSFRPTIFFNGGKVYIDCPTINMFLVNSSIPQASVVIDTINIKRLPVNTSFNYFENGTRPFTNKFIDLEKDSRFYIKNYDYPSEEKDLIQTLTDNSTDSISIGTKAYNRSIRIEYTIQRGTSYRQGIFFVLNNNGTIVFDPGSYFPVTDIGVSLDGAYLSGSSNTIKLKWTTTNTGQNATITYNIYRQNF